ncbi:MAG: hypothetical protein MRY21_06570 [Simkaniaceae bacterium]|nr:hypothetical protein [Simkaniaceae bacterium]
MRVTQFVTSAIKPFSRLIESYQKFSVAVPSNMLSENLLRVGDSFYLAGLAQEGDGVKVRHYSIIGGSIVDHKGMVYVGSVADTKSSKFNLYRHVQEVE